jgi:diacylglycerol kinase (ATP)
VAAECRERSVDVLGVCGGDGTLARTLSALVRVYGSDALPSIVPLRAGTMNTVARAMGCPAWQPERMLAEIVATYRSGRPLDATEHQLAQVNAHDYGFMVGAGVPVAFLRLYYEQPRLGARSAARTLARLIASVVSGGELTRSMFAPIPATLSCDGVPVRFGEYTVIYASTIEDIGLGFRPTYRARERAEHVHVFAGPIGAGELVRRLPAIKRGRPTGSAQVFDGLARTVRVEFREPTFYMVDGDIMEPTLQLSIVPGPIIRVIRR